MSWSKLLDTNYRFQVFKWSGVSSFVTVYCRVSRFWLSVLARAVILLRRSVPTEVNCLQRTLWLALQPLELKSKGVFVWIIYDPWIDGAEGKNLGLRRTLFDTKANESLNVEPISMKSFRSLQRDSPGQRPEPETPIWFSRFGNWIRFCWNRILFHGVDFDAFVSWRTQVATCYSNNNNKSRLLNSADSFLRENHFFNSFMQMMSGESCWNKSPIIESNASGSLSSLWRSHSSECRINFTWSKGQFDYFVDCDSLAFVDLPQHTFHVDGSEIEHSNRCQLLLFHFRVMLITDNNIMN